MILHRTGLFYEEAEALRIEGPSGEGESVEDLLAPYLGRYVHLILRHASSGPVDLSLWGGGCCKWYPSPCPFGHGDHPQRLYGVSLSGVLENRSGGWSVGPTALRFDWMNGHNGQLILFSPQPVESDTLVGMTNALTSLREVMESLKTEME